MQIRQTAVSIIVPTSNEEKNIQPLVERIHAALTQSHTNYEIIFIDDHSTDATQEIIKDLKKSYPISFFTKIGKKGKAFSLIEGFKHAQFELVCMLDADLQYPPESIPEMIKAIKDNDVIVANRTTYTSSWSRRVASRLNRLFFGKFLLGIDCDVQSGLKLFKKEILRNFEPKHITPWAFDMPFLFTALELGYSIGSVDITFDKRAHGKSKINFLGSAFEIAAVAMRLRLKRRSVYHFDGEDKNSMIGAGIAYKRKRFITHTTLPEHVSAIVTLKPFQLFLFSLFVGFITAGLIWNTKGTVITGIGVLSFIYLIDVFFNFFILLRSLHASPEIRIKDSEIELLNDDDLPIYTILCPLYKEAHLLPQFVESLSKLDWPKEKLEVLLLLEEDDKETIAQAYVMRLPSFVRIAVVPDSQPKTKPKACNFGLSLAKGEFVVVYDAEDMPDANQLKKAYAAFRKLPNDVSCLQAKLNYYNPEHNLLTKLFTAEYSLWFDVILPGLQSIGTSIPLGGTSNHFRTADLVGLEGWDTFNVTEDCDLGVRLFKNGYKTAIIDSTTLEEANSNYGNWIRQRSRWIKGYIQTYFVHMRSPLQFTREFGVHALIFHLVVGGKIAFMFINPILWLATLSYFALYKYVGPAIESVYPAPVFYAAATSLVMGNFMYLYYYMIGCAKRGHWTVIKYVYLVPFYWLMVSVAAMYAAIQLIFKPHYWEKTVHGFHLKKEEAGENTVLPPDRPTPPANKFNWLNGSVAAGAVFLAASVISNVLNFVYNAYLGRSIDVAEFGLVTLTTNFLYLTQVPLGALGKTITYKSAFLLGQDKTPSKRFWSYIRSKSILFGLAISAIWLALIPVLGTYFHVSDPLPFLLFTPVWTIGAAAAVDSGFLMGNMKYLTVSLVFLTDSISKLALSWFFVTYGLTQFVYAAIPLSMMLSFLVGWISVLLIKVPKLESTTAKAQSFPKQFFASALVTRLSTVAFLSIDIILAKHYLSPIEAGHYALLSLTGKMIFFGGSLFAQFLEPVVSKAEGAQKNSSKPFLTLLALTAFAGLCGVGILGFLAPISMPILLGAKTAPIIGYLPLYTVAILCFTLATTIVSYHQIKKHYAFSALSLIFTVIQVALIVNFHQNLVSFIDIMLLTGGTFLATSTLLHIFYQAIIDIVNNTIDFAGLFSGISFGKPKYKSSLSILIFNWRDTKHVWAGGAEQYVHNLARHWVAEGHNVTLFCGNDNKNPRNEVIDGVQVVRRGGFYTVYVWAIIYYALKFRGHYDVIIDSENGIPFFTPLFSTKPVFLLIHHIHQNVFREHLAFPLSLIARTIESKLMPMAYKNRKIITVSQSSKDEIIKLGMSKVEDIEVVHPGIDPTVLKKREKFSRPTVLYLGRLKPYKHVETAIKAFELVVKNHPTARMIIAGEGESLSTLQALSSSLGLEKSIEFVGKVSEYKKALLLAQSWVVIQPSSIEGWGMTVIESNACGTPVVASKVNGLKDSVIHGKTGMLVPVKDSEAFARSINMILEKPSLRNRLSQQASEWSRNFYWEKSAKSFRDIILRELTQRHRFPYVGKVALANR